MKKRAVFFMANGFEEIEAITPIDLLRRADIEVVLVSVGTSLEVVGSHNVRLLCDVLLSDFVADGFDAFVLPGGPGHKLLAQNENVLQLMISAHEKNHLVAAICAAPSILGALGILHNKRACCFTGFEDKLSCKEVVMHEPVVTDGNVITARGAGAAFVFGLAIVAYFFGKEKADKLAGQTIFMHSYTL